MPSHTLFYAIVSLIGYTTCDHILKCNNTNELIEDHFSITRLNTEITEELVLIKCQNKNISTVSETSFSFNNSQAVKLYLSKNSISTIPPGFLSNIKGLQVVYFTKNKIENLDPDLFKDLVVLEKIFLNKNNLTTLNADLFSTNVNLSDINLEENSIAELDNNLFKYNLKLSIVKLNMNKLTMLPGELFSNNPELTYLNLEFNTLTEFSPKLLSSNLNLTFLYLGDNKLTYIQKDTLKNNNKIEILSLKKNRISFIDDDWTHLANLKRLGIYRNKLDEFSERVFRLPSINELYLHHNEFACRCGLQWIVNFTFPVFEYKEINMVKKCSHEDSKEFYIYDFIVESRPNHNEAVEYLKSLNCTTANYSTNPFSIPTGDTASGSLGKDDSSKDLPMTMIIAGAGGSVLLLIVAFLIARCCCKGKTNPREVKLESDSVHTGVEVTNSSNSINGEPVKDPAGSHDTITYVETF